LENGTNNQVTQNIRRYEDGVFVEREDTILKEQKLAISVDGTLVDTLTCTAGHLDELALGYLFSNGLVTTLEVIQSLVIEGDTAYAKTVEVPLETRNPKKTTPVEKVKGKAGDWDPVDILRNANLLLSNSTLFRETGNVHSVMFCRGAKVLCFSEDVDRFNAFYKCLGQALKAGEDLSTVCAYTSGRIPSTLVQRVIRSGLTMLVSRSAPTDAALKLAREHSITIIGFAKGTSFNLYE